MLFMCKTHLSTNMEPYVLTFPDNKMMLWRLKVFVAHDEHEHEHEIAYQQCEYYCKDEVMHEYGCLWMFLVEAQVS